MKTENLYPVGRGMYLAGIGFLGALYFIFLDFVMTRPKPWPGYLQDLNPALAYIAGSVMIVAAIFVFVKWLQKIALLAIANLILWLATSRHLMTLWEDKVNSYKSVVFICGALLIYHTITDSATARKYLLWFSLVITSLFFLHCAIGHFVAARYVQLLTPEYIPFRLFFTYFAGVCLALASIGLLIPRLQKITALLSGIQITGWFILLHIPRAITMGDRTWIGVGESLALAGICFMLYGIVKKNQSKIL